MTTNGLWQIHVDVQSTRGCPTTRDGAIADLREVKRARGGGNSRSRGGGGFDATGIVARVGRSGGYACEELLGFVKEDVLDKEQYS